jgi:hypothetical protein
LEDVITCATAAWLADWLMHSCKPCRVYFVFFSLVCSIYDSTELAIQKMIEASQRMIDVNSQVGEAKEGWGINPAVKRHLELEIKTLRNAPRDADKLRRLILRIF